MWFRTPLFARIVKAASVPLAAHVPSVRRVGRGRVVPLVVVGSWRRGSVLWRWDSSDSGFRGIGLFWGCLSEIETATRHSRG